jgi:hypothetical protein
MAMRARQASVSHAPLLGEPTGGMPSSVTQPSALTGLLTVVVVVYSRAVPSAFVIVVVTVVVVVVEGMLLLCRSTCVAGGAGDGLLSRAHECL